MYSVACVGTVLDTEYGVSGVVLYVYGVDDVINIIHRHIKVTSLGPTYSDQSICP